MKVSQSYPTLCNPMDSSPPGSSVHAILQARYWSGLHYLLQGIFPTQGGMSCIGRQILLPLSPQGSLSSMLMIQ